MLCVQLTEQTQVQVFAAEAEQSELARKIEENEHLHRKVSLVASLWAGLS